MSLEVYKASAGSGKTFQLALEYIYLALESGSPNAFNNILAVTFTNKATAEMKDRILAQLYNLAHGCTDESFYNELQKKLNLSKAEIEKRADKTLHAIIRDYDHFRVETIDSFFQSLLSNLAHELNLTRGFRVNLDSNEVISKAVDKMLQSVGTNENVTEKICKTILDYMEEQIEDDKGWNIAKSLKDFAKSNLFNDIYLQNEEQLNEQIHNNSAVQKLKAELYQERKKYSEPLKIKAHELLQYLQQPVAQDFAMQKKIYSKGTAYLQGFFNNVFHKEPDSTKIKNAIEDPEKLLNKAQKNDPEWLAFANDISNKFGEIEEERKAIAPYMATSSLILENLTPLLLLNEIGRQVTNISNDTGSFLLAKTPDLFNKMVKKEDSSFIFEKSGTTFKHVMIDEFQDTSGTQWKNFKNLLVENMSQADECMLVGDIKQSIYRWRGGDWGILANIENEMGHHGNVCAHYLETNYRSQKEVVEFNNEFFKFVPQYFNKDCGIDNRKAIQDIIEKIYAKTEQKIKPGNDKGYVRIALPAPSSTDEEILEEVYEQIHFLYTEKHIPYDQMGILVRRNAEAIKIIEYFSKEHPEIPLTSDDAFQLSASPAVLLLINALKYLNDKSNTVALSICRQTANRLSEIAQVEIPTDFAELEEWREELVKMPLYELCQKLLIFFKIPQAEAQGLGQSAYLYSFLDQVMAYADDKSSDLTAFLEYWDEQLYKKAIAVNIKDSIYIMTIHKSKGLEKHTILIPFCNWPMEEDHREDTIWCDTHLMPSPFNEVPIVPINPFESSKVKSSYLSPFYFKEHLEQFVDSINALYVAFTRAEHNLLVWSKVKGKNNTIDALVYGYCNRNTKKSEETIAGNKKGSKESAKTEITEWSWKIIGEPQDYIVKTHNKISSNPLDAGSAEDITTTLKVSTTQTEFRQSNQAKDFINEIGEEFNDEDGLNLLKEEGVENKKQQNYINRGKLLHQLFSMISTADDVDKAIRTLAQQGFIESDINQDKLKKFILKRISTPQTAPWFDGTWKLFAECNILMRNNDGKIIQRRPDRVMQNANETIVIDYKFGNFNNQYITQVQEYMRALQKMGITHVKGYLWFVYSGEIREVTL